MRDLEGSYFCFTGQGTKPRPRSGLDALASPHLVTRWSSEFPMEGLAMIKSEQDQPKIGQGGIILDIINCCLDSHVKSEKFHDEVSEQVLVVKY